MHAYIIRRIIATIPVMAVVGIFVFLSIQTGAEAISFGPSTPTAVVVSSS